MRIAQFSDLHYCPKHLAESDRCFGFAVDETIRRQVQVAVISGDATDHQLDLHAPAVHALVRQVRRLTDHCPVLMLQGTFSHEPPGTLDVFRHLGGRYPVHVADTIHQVALTVGGRWCVSDDWCFRHIPENVVCLFSCVPSINKGAIAGSLGAQAAADAVGDTVADLLAGFGPINRVARERGIPTVGVSHGTVNGCLTEHGVPMAGLDHEFTTGALSAARASAFMLGHIHKHQVWECGARVIAYPGSIGRFHYGEAGDKGFLIWDVGADGAGLEFVATPAKRTLDIVFDGKPDMDRLRAEAQTVNGAFVRVRWSVLEEERASVDRVAIEAALAGAAGLQLEGRVIPMIAARAAGISALPNIAEKVRRWAQVTEIDPEPMVACLEALHSGTPEAIATAILGEASSIARYPSSRLEAST